MIRKWTIPFLGLLMALFLVTPALAAAEYGVIYDETEQLRSESLVYAGETTLPALTEQYGIDLRVDVLAQSDYDTVLDAAEGIYEKYEYGYGENRSGITLTLLLSPSGDGYRMKPGDWCVYLGGTDEDLIYGDWLTDIADAVEPYMAEQAWSGDMDMSAIALSQAVGAMANAVEDCFGDGSRSDHTPAPDQEESERQLGYVFDTVPLLNDGEWNRLENMAETVSTRYSCGVYIVTVDDYKEYGTGDVFDVATQIYHDDDIGLGVGAGRDGIMLLLSMDNRDWSMFVYGENAEYAFNSYGQEQLEEIFLDNFADNDWYGGFSDYIEACGEYLAKAEAGKPVRSNPLWGIGLSTGLSCLVALAVCMVMKRKMKTARQKIEADAYISDGGLMLTASHDHYTHTTETSRKIERSSGSSSRSGGDGSGRSGKF